MYLSSIQLRSPLFNLENFSLSWKDFGELRAFSRKSGATPSQEII